MSHAYMQVVVKLVLVRACGTETEAPRDAINKENIVTPAECAASDGLGTSNEPVMASRFLAYCMKQRMQG